MYVEHQPLIARHARTPEGFADVATFVIASINQHFYRVPSLLKEIRLNGFEQAKGLTGLQKRGIAYAHANAARYVAGLRLRECGGSPIVPLRRFIEIPCIGIAKAGFLMQLTCGQVGCLDRHNLRTCGLDTRAFERIPASTEALTARLEAYCAACATLGTCAQIYDGWCQLMATKYPQHFADAEDVSVIHLKCCNLL